MSKVLVKGTDKISIVKGADQVVNAVVLDDNGAPLDLTSATAIGLALFARSNRAATAAQTLTGALVDATAGHISFTIADDGLTSVTAGQTYNAWLSFTISGSVTVVPNAISVKII